MGDAYAMAFYGYALTEKRPGWVHHFHDNAEAIEWLHANVLDAREPKKGKRRRYIEQEYENELIDALGTLEEGSGFDDRLEPWHLRFAQAEGIELPAAAKGAIPKAARKAFLRKLSAALEAEPCQIERIQYGFTRPEEDFIVTPKASAIGDGLEHRIVPLPELKVAPEWDAQIEAFSKKLGLVPKKPFGWMMASFAFE